MISVVLSTYNRGHLLDRSLECYWNQHLKEAFELIIVDDGSTDDTFEIVSKWTPYLDLKYIRLWKKLDEWRDCAKTINIGIRASKGDLIIGTHPEVMPGQDSLQRLWDLRRERAYLACKIYYLTSGNQALIDTVDWRNKGAAAVRELPNFYEDPSAEFQGDYAYSHRATDKHTEWGSWVFGGFTRETWKWLGGFTEFDTWGSVDVDLMNRRNILGIPTVTPMETSAICVHQNHDVPVKDTDVLTPRDMKAAMAPLPVYQRPEDALRKNLW